MKTFKQFVTEAVVDWRIAHKEISDSGYRNDNAGGGYSQDHTRNAHWYTKSHNINGDDHRYTVHVDYKSKKPKFTATHSVSRQYWGSRWENPGDHLIADRKEFRSHKRAVQFLEAKFKRNAKLKAKK